MHVLKSMKNAQHLLPRVASACLVCMCLVGAIRAQDYVQESTTCNSGAPSWAIGWDVGRLLRGQAVGTVEHWFHPEFSVQLLGGAMVADPIAGLPQLGAEVDWNVLESGSTMGIGFRFHPMPEAGAPVNAFIGFELNRDRYEYRESTGPNVWLHREVRVLIGATRQIGEHWGLTGHVAVNATQDRFMRRAFTPNTQPMSLPGRVAGLQLTYSW